ncbi:MAG: DUF4093 domain-containing protein [Oscillospiraceae bacterium]|jgi:ribonuclease M5|nr:DUF4093 domain-containing protein [Oscillospiraceae bacterium]
MTTANVKPHIRETIIVEGRYDKAALSNAVDANIIELGGFRIYKDRIVLDLIRKLASGTGVIVLTDSDKAGFQLRNYLNGAVSGRLVHAYIPDVAGKERRKAAPSKEGKLGVEGMGADVLRKAILTAVNYAADDADRGCDTEPRITKLDFYELGLTGASNSAKRRRDLARSFDLPERLSADSLISVLNALGVSPQDLRTSLTE